ncbi:MAG: ATP-grasp domain-containing protein [Acidimicrobiia bacterium]|nr:ATP-grasp domain-containing protein [Acidimicrobiia bacterium]MDQ3500752.1 ATP-grasp domain-containing protein [Actinomycetota bacterium]
MNILFLSPGFPTEMTDFVRGLAEVGANVIGLGDQAEGAVPPKARMALSAYYQVSFSRPESVIETAAAISRQVRIDRVESLWEPLMILAAQVREALGIAGMTQLETIPFRDKEAMKQVLDSAGIRTPHHYSAKTMGGIWDALEKVGYPAIIKPISGAGSIDTHRVDGPSDVEAIAPSLRHIEEVSIEEFVDGEEFTFDTICANGNVLFYNICWYRPRPLLGKTNEWVSQQTLALRNPDVAELASGKQMGVQVLKAMNFRDGFTHMEWYLKSDGEAVFGEIGARPPGGRTVDAMNFASDVDLFRCWAEATVHGQLSEPLDRKFNAVTVFKRAIGQGHIQRYEGLDRLLAELEPWIVATELNPIGASRRNWKQQLIGDGMVVVRHPDLRVCTELADRVGTDLQIYAS